MKTDGIDDDDDDIAMKDGTTDVLGGAVRENEDEEDEDVYVRICFLSGALITSASLTLKISRAVADPSPLRCTCFGRREPHGSDHRQFPTSKASFRPPWTLLVNFSLADYDWLR